MAETKPDELLTLAQVCKEYQVSEETVRRWMREKRIPFVLVGPFRMKRISRAAIETPVPAHEPIDPFDPQGELTQIDSRRGVTSNSSPQSPGAVNTGNAASATAPTPRVSTVTKTHKRDVFLSCDHKFKQGDGLPMPKVGATVSCPNCPKGPHP